MSEYVDTCDSCNEDLADDELRKIIDGTDYACGEYSLVFCADCWEMADLSDWGIDQDDFDKGPS